MSGRSKNKGLFIGLIGVPGTGKSTIASALAKKLGVKAFIEPGEEFYPLLLTGLGKTR